MKITKEIKLENKIKWVIEYCKKDNHANILNSNFVDKYVEKFNPKYRGVNFGAFKCPELGRLLSLMYHKNILDCMIYLWVFLNGFIFIN
jgi:hypothetical protein